MRKDFKTGLYTLLILGTTVFSSLGMNTMSVNAKEPETAYYIDAKASSYDPREYEGRMTPVRETVNGQRLRGLKSRSNSSLVKIW